MSHQCPTASPITKKHKAKATAPLLLVPIFATLVLSFNNCQPMQAAKLDQASKNEVLTQDSVFNNSPSPLTGQIPIGWNGGVGDDTPPPMAAPTYLDVHRVCSNRGMDDDALPKVNGQKAQRQPLHKSTKAQVKIEFQRVVKVNNKDAAESIGQCALTNAQQLKQNLMIKAGGKLDLSSCQIPKATQFLKISYVDDLGSEHASHGNAPQKQGVLIHAAALKGPGALGGTIASKVGSIGVRKNLEVVYDVNLAERRDGDIVPPEVTPPEEDLCDSRQSPLFVDLRDQWEKQRHFGLTAPWDGVLFDIMGANAEPIAYEPMQISWFQSSSFAFLALPDAEGKVRGIDQLFGNNTKGPDGKFAENGYDALAKHDANGDQVIDANDRIYGQLRVWRDHNLDGVADSRELQSLSAIGLKSIDLRYDDRFYERDQYGNEVKYKSVAKTYAGEMKLVFDVWFETRTRAKRLSITQFP